MLHLNPIDGVTISYLHTDCRRAVRMEVAIEQLGDGMLIFVDLYDLSHKAGNYHKIVRNQPLATLRSLSEI